MPRRPLAAVMQQGLSIMLILTSAFPVFAQEVNKSQMQACPMSAAELRKSLGVDVKAGKPTEMPYPAGRMLSCSYQGPAAATSVLVSQTWIPPKLLADTLASMDQYASGKFVDIAGDADKARWQFEPGIRNNLALHYTRKNVRTEVRVQGGRFVNEDMQARLLKLKRVP